MTSPYLKGPFTVDTAGGYVFVKIPGKDRLMFAQVRGWGQLQYQEDGVKLQDEHLQFLVDALNEKATGTVLEAGEIDSILEHIEDSRHWANEDEDLVVKLEKLKAALERK